MRRGRFPHRTPLIKEKQKEIKIKKREKLNERSFDYLVFQVTGERCVLGGKYFNSRS